MAVLIMAGIAWVAFKPDAYDKARARSEGTRSAAGRGSSKDDADTQTGPLILWQSCTMQIEKSGVRVPHRFERLRAAAIAAASWTDKVFAWTSATADFPAIAVNRDAGLLEATRRGNVMKNLDLSHQLDR